MFIKFEKEYNPKIDFKMIFSLYLFYYSKLKNYVEAKKVFKHIKEPSSSQTKLIYTIDSSFQFLKHANFQTIDEESIVKIATDLRVKNLDFTKISNLVKMLHEQNNNTPIQAIRVFEFIVKDDVFNDFSVAIGMLFMNSILYQDNYIPIVIFKDDLLFFKRMIKSQITLESLVDIFSSLKDISLKYLDKFEKLSTVDVIECLKNNKNEIIEKFNVTKIWLFGSFVRNEQTLYSDIDLYVELKDEKQKEMLENYLSNLLNRAVDVQIEGHVNPLFNTIQSLKERELIIDAN